MNIDTYHAQSLEELLSAPSKEAQLQAAADIGYFTCIEIAVEAHALSDHRRRGQIETLLNRLYHGLKSDPSSPPRYHWPAIVAENYKHFHHYSFPELLWEGIVALIEGILSIPVLGVLIIIPFAIATAIAMGLLYLALLPFPNLHERVTSYMDAWTTVAENAQ